MKKKLAADNVSLPISAKKRGNQAASAVTPFITAIGASAGGLEAFTQLLEVLPAKTGMVYVLIQHLEPNHPSQLRDLLAKVSEIPVLDGAEGMKVQPDHIYVIPPNVSMTVRNSTLHLLPRKESGTPFLPVDIFLQSLAEDQHEAAIGVILSGTANDGARGVESIKACGGITFAQDRDSAKFSGMPMSAIRTGCIDFILTPAEIAQELARISGHPRKLSVAESDSGRDAAVGDDAVYAKILSVLRQSSGVDFASYRESTIRRRILRRMVLHNKHTLQEYLDFMGDAAESDALYHDLLINVTSFFRDPEVFEALKISVFPQLLQNRQNAPPIRIWVPGCSTGQEVYSIAIALLEFLEDKVHKPDIQIFGTDLSEGGVLRMAREGLFPDTIEIDMAPDRLRKFFTREGNHYRINRSIRDICVFSRHNVAADPPFSRMDLISCRNLLIYLALPLQRRVIPTFHYALNQGGYLLLGASETIGMFTDLFSVVEQNLRIYCKNAAVFPEYPHFASKGYPASIKSARSAQGVNNPAEWQKEADRIVLNKYIPPGVLVNDNLDILQFRGRTGQYLEAPSGEPSHNLLRMACDGLFPALRKGIEECRKSGQLVPVTGVRIRKDGKLRGIDIQIFPVKLTNSTENCFLILFAEVAAESDQAGPMELQDYESAEVQRLQQELVSMQEYVQSVVEEKDAINEELRATNEEFLSANEELQSTNEELETAKEELQSVNEELTTVNEQVSCRNKELSFLNDRLQDASDYAEAIVKTIREPLVVLDADLRIQSANPAFYRTFRVTSDETEGCLFYRLSNRQWDIPELREALDDIMASQSTLTDFEVTTAFEIIGQRSMLLNACSVVKRDHEAPLILLSIEDISKRRALEKEANSASERLLLAGHQKDEFLATLSHELRNPLTPMRNALELMRSPAATPEMTRRAQTILDRQMMQMVHLVDDLLDISRMTRGKIELRLKHVPLADIVRDAVDSVRPCIDAAEHTLTVSLPPETLWLKADASRMAQVLGNLLNNAAKYTPRGGVISLTAEQQAGSLLLHIKDNGVGIPTGMLSRIFDMFSQVDSSMERSQGGMGIGLALVRNLVERHGGGVFAVSDGLGRGSEFIIRLPLAQNIPAAVVKPAPQVEIAPDEEPRRILVVDDNVDIAKTVGWLFQLVFRQDVRVANDGAQALRIAAEFVPELILLDIGLPGMNGYDVCKSLRRQPQLKNTMIVAITGWGQHEHRERSREAGFDLHLVKPVTLDGLREVIMTLQQRTRDIEAGGSELPV